MKVVDEKQIRGTIERTYALTAPPSLTVDDLEGMTRQEAEQYFNYVPVFIDERFNTLPGW